MSKDTRECAIDCKGLRDDTWPATVPEMVRVTAFNFLRCMRYSVGVSSRRADEAATFTKRS